MHIEILTEEQKKFLEVIKEDIVLGNYYLAGGTGLALSIGHRRSYDFDFFSQAFFQPDNIINLFEKFGHIFVITKTDGSITFEVLKQRVSFFYYPYPLLYQILKTKWSFPLADFRDIVPMKLSAIASRGSRKDFIDLYFVLDRFISLQEAIEIMRRKFQGIEYNFYHILRSLTYFEDAEEEPMPQMLKKCKWEDVKSFFEAEVKKIWKKNMGL